MKKLYTLLFLTLLLGSLAARKPVDTLSARHWEFVQNLGQWDANVLYAARTNSGNIFFESKSLTITQLHPKQLQDFHEAKHSGKPISNTLIDAAAYRITFINANPSPEVGGIDPYRHYYNYFLGRDPKHWASHVSVYNSLQYNQLYNKISLLFLEENDYFKYEFHIAPGGDPHQIQLRYDGLKSIAKVGEELLLHTDVDRVLELAPYAYQINHQGDTLTISCSYRLHDNIVTFELGDYSPSLPLVIDPTVVFSSYSGSTSDNWGYTATYDSHGNLYGGGIVFGTGYPVTLGAYQLNFAGQVDVSISKFDATGSFLHYSTYLGGSVADIPHSLHVNDNDELYIFGTTGSANFPVTAGAYDTSFNGGPNTTLSTSMKFLNGSDIFIAKLSADGAQLPASTFVGGTGNDGINTAYGLRINYADDNRGEIIVDANSNVYVVSSSHSADFPITSNIYAPDNTGNQKACVFKMSQDLSTMVWSALYGGSGLDAGYSMYLAADNSVYFCGGTTSPDLPVTAGALQPLYADSASIADGFVAHISANGNFLLHSTYLGKSGYDQAYLIKGDDEDFPHILGQTYADGMQWVQNVAYYVPGGGQFLTKLSKNLSNVLWSTAFGSGLGGPDISPTALMVDYCNNIYLSGWGSANLNGFGGTNGLPVTADAFQTTTDGSDFYFMAISDDAANLVYATYLGGAASSAREHVDGGTSRFDKHGRIYQAVCAGCGGQSTFPTTPGVVSNVNGSTNCNLGAVKIDFNMPVVVADFLMPNVVCLPDTVFFENYSQLISSQTSFSWNFGDGTTSTQWEPHHLYANTGYYEVTLVVEDLGSCNMADTLRKRILVLANTNSILPAVPMCEGDFAEIGLPPSVGVNYQWSPVESLSNPGISNPIATPEQSTTYTLIASTAACVDTLSQYVDVHTLDATLTGDSVICLGDAATLTIAVQSADIYHVEWSESADFLQLIATDTHTIDVTPVFTNTFYVRVTTDQCTRIYPFTVTVNQLSISGNIDYLQCFEDYLTLGVTCSGGILPYQYDWQLGDGSTHVGPNPNVAPQHSTSYEVTVTDAIGCTATAGGFIKVREGTFPEELEAWCEPCMVVAYHETNLHATDYGTGYIYQWTPTTNVESPNMSATVVTPDTTMTYTVTVTDTFGCVRTDTVTITVQPITCDMPFVFIPNSFTPNGDGVNDVLYVRSEILEKCYFAVYNRWGEKVFETYDNSIGWDGTFHGKECSRATYDWYFKGTCKDGDETELKGSVTLIR